MNILPTTLNKTTVTFMPLYVYIKWIWDFEMKIIIKKYSPYIQYNLIAEQLNSFNEITSRLNTFQIIILIVSFNDGCQLREHSQIINFFRAPSQRGLVRREGQEEMLWGDRAVAVGRQDGVWVRGDQNIGLIRLVRQWAGGDVGWIFYICLLVWGYCKSLCW